MSCPSSRTVSVLIAAMDIPSRSKGCIIRFSRRKTGKKASYCTLNKMIHTNSYTHDLISNTPKRSGYQFDTPSTMGMPPSSSRITRTQSSETSWEIFFTQSSSSTSRRSRSLVPTHQPHCRLVQPLIHPIQSNTRSRGGATHRSFSVKAYTDSSAGVAYEGVRNYSRNKALTQQSLIASPPCIVGDNMHRGKKTTVKAHQHSKCMSSAPGQNHITSEALWHQHPTKRLISPQHRAYTGCKSSNSSWIYHNSLPAHSAISKRLLHSSRQRNLFLSHDGSGSGGGSGTTVTSESKKAWVSMLRQKTLVRASIPQLWETYSEVVNNEALSLLRSDDVVVLYQALSRSIQVEEATEMMLQVALDLSNIDKQLPQEAFQILLNQALDNLPAEQFKAVVWQIQGRRRFISEFIQMCDSNTEMKALIDLYTRLIKDSFPLDGHPDYYQSRKERANSLGDIILNWIKDESDNVDRKVVEGLLVYLLSRGVLDKVYTCIGSLSKQGFLFTHRFYTTAIHQFGCEGEFDYMELTLSLMRNQGLEPLEDTYSAIIDAHSKAGNLREAQRTYQEAVAAGIVPTDTVLGPILEAVGKMGDYGMTQLLVEQMSSTGVPPNEYTFSALLQSVAQNPEKSISLFEELSKQMTPNRVNYNLLIRTLQRHGDLDGAYRIFRSMANNSARPDMYTLSSILSLFASRGDSEGAEAFWNEMVNVHEVVPNVHAYGSMMHVYCVTGNMLSAQSVYREMIKAGILPNEVIFGTLLNAYARRGDLTQMLSIYDAMRAEGLKPNSYIYSNLLFGLVKDGDMASARRLYENMEEDGYGDNVLAQTILMKGYLDKGRFHESQVVYKNMLRAGLIPNFMTYATLLQAHVKRGEKKEAQAFLDKIMSSRGLVVDPEDEREEAAEVEEDKQQGKKETVKLKSTEDRDLSSSLSLEDEGDPQSSFQQGHLSEFGTERKPLKTAARPNPLFAFTPLLDAYAKEGDITAANLIFDEIKARGLQPNTITYTILMDCYKRAGDVDTVKRLWSEMFERFQKQWEINSSRPNNERPSKYTAINLKQDRLSTKASKLQRLMQSPISIVLDSLGYSGRVQEAKNIWGELEKMNYKFDSSNWNDYCIVLLRNGLILDACMILQSILLPGFHSDKEVESGLSTGSEDTFTIKSPRSRVIASDAIQPPSKTSPLSLSNQGNLESTGDMGDLTKGVQRKTLFYPRPRTFAALADALSELLSPNNGSKIRYQEFMSDALIHLPSTPSSSESDVAARSLQSKRLEKQKQLIETKLLAYPHPFDNFDENSRKVLWNLVRTEYPHVLEALSEGMPAASASKRYGKIAKGGEEESNPGTSHRNPRFSGFDPWRRLKSVMRDLERKKFIENRNAAMQEREDRFALLRNRKPR